MGVVVALGIFGTFAAFTATTTNSGNQIQSGTVALSDNDSGQSMYQVTDQKPGDVTERCLKVTYSGSLDSTVKLYASAVGSFGSHVDLTVTPGTTTAGFSGCGSFAADSKGAIYTGTLGDFATKYNDYTSGLTDYPGSSVRWAQGDTVAYRFTLTVRDDFAPNEATSQLSTAAHDFTFEARNGEYPQGVLNTSGLVSFWRLGESSGTSAGDARSQNPGTYNNGVALGVVGAQSDGTSAASFDGVDDHVLVSNSASLQATQGTLEAWVKTTTPGIGHRGIVVKGGTYGLYLYNGNLATRDYSTATLHDSGVNLADGRWHHVAMSYQSGVSGGTVLYADGVPKLTTTITISGNTNQLVIGAANNGTKQFLAGSIDEPAFYSRALTAAEIQNHYNAR